MEFSNKISKVFWLVGVIELLDRSLGDNTTAVRVHDEIVTLLLGWQTHGTHLDGLSGIFFVEGVNGIIFEHFALGLNHLVFEGSSPSLLGA